MSGQLTAAEGTGSQEFKQRIYKHLKKTGVVSSLKSQLRSQLLEQLRKLSDPDAVRAATELHDQRARSMWHSAVNSLIAEYLQTSNLQFTLSVFNSEADVTEQPAFSVDDLCQLMRLDRQPQLLERVQQLMQSEGCLAVALMQALSATAGSAATVDSSCQTSTAGQMENLGQRLLQLEDDYVHKAAVKHGMASRVTLEEQMAAYKQECDALMEVQVAARVARIKEVELATARQEAAAKYRQQLELDRAELERIHADRLARLAAREDEVTEKLRRQQRDVESVAYTQRQRILAEEERIKGMKAEVGRQLEVQEQLLNGLEAQLKERERAVVARETAAEAKLAEAAELESKLAAAARKQAAAELSEEQAALRGERVALEAERARVAELRQNVNADLAVARAKEDRLHALESARAEAEARSAAHAAGEEVLRLQLKHLQTEVAALQQELERAGAAAGASAAAEGGYQLYPSGEVGAVAAAVVSGTGGGPVQLPQVLRELGQWQRRAQEAELALDEATVERDSAVSRAEELTVTLNAARRDISALRSQVSRQQQDIIHLKLQLSHANAAAAAACSRNPFLGLRGSNGSSRGAAFPHLASPVAGASGLQQSPPKGLGGLGLGSANLAVPGGTDYATGDLSASPLPGSRPRAQSAVGFRHITSTAAAAGGVGQGSLRQVAASAGGVDEVRVTASRIAQLAAADASMINQLEDFRRRSASQRAAAARQLADLRAVAGSSSGGGAAGGSRGGAAAAAPAGFGGAQHQQCRLSIPAEFDTADIEEEQGIHNTFDEQLLQQQQRRAALEAALQPPAAATQLANPSLAPDAQTNNSSGSRPASAAVGVYRLEDVLRAVGVVRSSTSSPQQHEQPTSAVGAAQAPELADNAEPVRAANNDTELSLVVQVGQQQLDLVRESGVVHEVCSHDQQQQHPSLAANHEQSASPQVQQAAVADALTPSHAAAQDEQTETLLAASDKAAASQPPGLLMQEQQQEQRQQDVQSCEKQQLDPGNLHGSVESGPDPLQAMTQDESSSTVSQSLAKVPQGSAEGDRRPEEDQPINDAASTTDAAVNPAETDDIDEGFELSDDFVAELSAISSAAAAMEAAADAEEARLSSSSVALTTASGRAVERYGAATGDVDTEDDESQPEPAVQGPQLFAEAESAVYQADSAAQYDAHSVQQQSSTAVAEAAVGELRMSAESWGESPADVWSPQQQQQRRGSGAQSQEYQPSPGSARFSRAAGSQDSPGREDHAESSYESNEDDEYAYDIKVAAGELDAVAEAVETTDLVQSPESSEESVF